MTLEPERGEPPPRMARHRSSPEKLTRRSAALTLLGAIVPGAGLIKTRYRRLGWLLIMFLVMGASGVAGVVLLIGPTKAALEVAVRPRALLALSVSLIVGGLIWVATLVLTHQGTMHSTIQERQRTFLRWWTAALCLAVATPLGVVVQYSLIQRDTVSAVFSSHDTRDDRQAPNADQADPWAGVGELNMLLIGSDAGNDRVGVRTDSMILAHIDTATGETVLFSLPRNLQNVPFPKDNPLHKIYPNGYRCGPQCLLNAVWTEAVNHARLFDDDIENPGLYTLKGVIEEVTELRIDYTTIVDLKGFEAFVDAMGGVTVNVRERLPVQGWRSRSGRLRGVEEWIEPGVQHLDGYHALWFARSRLASDDYSRMRRQRCLVGKAINQMDPATMLKRYPQLARAARENIATDIPARDLPFTQLPADDETRSHKRVRHQLFDQPPDPHRGRGRRRRRRLLSATRRYGGIPVDPDGLR